MSANDFYGHRISQKYVKDNHIFEPQDYFEINQDSAREIREMKTFWKNNKSLKRWLITRIGGLTVLAVVFLFTGHLDLFLLTVTMVFVIVIRKIRPWLVERWPYFEEKPSAPYIISFMVLLIFCAFLLILKLEPVAEQVANVAYFLLVIGVGIEFTRLIREKGNVEDD